MDLNFYSDLSDGTGQHVDSEFMDNSSYNGYDPVNKFAGGNDSYLTISGPGHHWSSEKTFHTPCLGDEEFEIPPISLDPDSALTIEDVEAHFGELAEQAETSSASGVGNSLASNPVVGGNDPSFASAFMNPSSQGIEHLSMGVINQRGGSALLSSTLGVDLGHSVGSHFNSSSSMTIDVPINDMNHSLLGHSQLTTIDHSDLSAQLGLSLGGGGSVSKSLDQPLSTTDPAGSLQDEDMEDFRQKTMLVDPSSASPAILSSAPPAVVRRVGGKPAMVPLTAADTGATHGGKKGKKKKDPNEPQKPVSAYALFFRDTQAAIKGQNPNATFGEVSKIVASMWDSLGEEQKQVEYSFSVVKNAIYLKYTLPLKCGQYFFVCVKKLFVKDFFYFYQGCIIVGKSWPNGIVGGGSECTALSSTFNTTTEVPLSKAPNPQLLPGRRSKNGCPLLRVCVHGVCVFTAVCVHFGWDKCRAAVYPVA
uniref:TOX high mobility group box family member 4-like n=1 Tax=Sinocyclocheilus rhinocerous TaxID=307959 RepID=A0A673IXS9_9TELE